MTVINVSDYGIYPGQECGAELERLISNIPRDSSEKVLNFQSGEYIINALNLKKRMLYITNTAGDKEYSKNETPHKAAAALYFENFKNMTVEGNGATFKISGKATNCVIENCENFTLRGITFRTDKPDFHSLKVISKSAFYVDFELSGNDEYEFRDGTVIFKGNGFETDIKSKSKIAWWPNKISGENNERNSRSRHPLALSLCLKKISENTVRSYCISTANFKIGDIFYIFDNRRQYVGVFVDNSRNVTVENTAQHFNYSLAYVCQCSENITLKNLDCTPEEGEYLTSVADFVQICMCRGNVSVTDSVFSGAGDDCLNCHGFNFKVSDADGNKINVKFMHPQSHGYNPFKEGDKLAIIDAASLLETGNCETLSSKMLDEYTIELTVRGDIPKTGDMIENVSACPSLYFARNEVHRIVTRGILVTTRGKVNIEDNRFYGNSMSGILISDDASSWYESGPCTDVTVKNNIFDYCGEYGVMIKPENKVHKGAVHRNITVTGNTFSECKKECFFASSSADLTFTDNKIGISKGKIKTENCENVTV